MAEILLDELATVRANIDGAIDGQDAAALHALRVSIRRSRTLLKGMHGVFAPADQERFAAEFKELQGITGPVRDSDVLLEELEAFAIERPHFPREAAALRRELLRRRRSARNKLKRRLTSKRFADLLDAWQETLESLPSMDEAERPDAAIPIGELAGARILADHKRFLKLGRVAIRSGDPATVHHARKRGKALRYDLEFFGNFGDRKVAARLIRQLKAAQDELGAYQDTVAREAELRRAVQAADTVMVATSAGALIERALIRRGDRLDRFADRYSKLCGKKQRAKVKRAFAPK
ncbi:MAG: CHAD domain-containing protein [Solirubrobacterales bacterium]|nr:CHAD domain-containing protein [Solirubrobacterales bacterium]